MNKDLFNTILAIATQGENVKISKKKKETYEKLIIQTIVELDKSADQLFSKDILIRKKAASYF